MDALLRRLALAIGVLCGLAATQAPEFAQQYRQRLAGAVDELSRVVDQFKTEAASHSLDPAAALARLEANPDALARERAAAMRSDMSRLTRLETAATEFKDAGPLRRLGYLAVDFDPATARAAWTDFEPAVPTTVESFVIGALGSIAGWAATLACAWPLRRNRARRLATG